MWRVSIISYWKHSGSHSNHIFNFLGLQGELSAAHKDDEYVRKKLKLLEDEKVILRHKYSENQDEFQNKYGEHN